MSRTAPMNTRRRPAATVVVALALLLSLLASLASAAPAFPPLTGRVVDNAQLLSAEAAQRVEALLAAHEAKTTNQVVVATLPDLQGYAIDDYGYQLGRAWGIGQKDRDNGALLIIAPNERKLRIEVGYGLEGALTDALSSDIIANTIAPHFKDGDFDGGVEAGVARMLAVLEGDAAASALPPPPGVEEVPGWVIALAVVFAVMFIAAISLGGTGSSQGIQRGGFGGGFGGSGGFPRGGGGFGGGGGGGFGGGGGGFGGGGASGGW